MPIKIQETNKGVALATAYQWLKKLLRKNPELVEPWMQTYSDMLENGFSEKVSEQDLLKTDCFHYIQTFPIVQPHKETHKVTPPIAKILCVINPRAIVVCGFLMKSL